MTTIEETITKLQQMRLSAMASAARELLSIGPGTQLDLAEMLTLLVDREWTHRENRRVTHRLKNARLRGQASVEAVEITPERGLSKAALRQLATCKWVEQHHNVIIVGKTGVGKSYLATALADAACRQGHRALFLRSTRLLEEMALARATGKLAAYLARLSRIEVLVIDDFLVAPLSSEEQRDLLELFEDRYDQTSTIITSQMKTKTWHSALGDPTMADAICDRVIHNSHILDLGGPSVRALKALNKPTS